MVAYDSCGRIVGFVAAVVAFAGDSVYFVYVGYKNVGIVVGFNTLQNP